MMRNLIIFILLFSLFSLFYETISCNDNPSGNKTTTLDVLVVDNDPQETPIPEVEITITPGNVNKRTSSDGTCSFSLKPGDYYVNAQVCCIGPGYIQYHEPVNLTENETETIKLVGCLTCE